MSIHVTSQVSLPSHQNITTVQSVTTQYQNGNTTHKKESHLKYFTGLVTYKCLVNTRQKRNIWRASLTIGRAIGKFQSATFEKYVESMQQSGCKYGFTSVSRLTLTAPQSYEMSLRNSTCNTARFLL